MSIYEKVKKLCEREGFAISSLGDKIPNLSINKASITGWKKGSIPRPDKIKKIADYFGVDVDYFYDDENASVPAKKALDMQDKQSEKQQELINSIMQMSSDEVEKMNDYLTFILSKRK
nr:MAG TPA: repressor protein [Caudoviricetes sp.]